MDPVTDRRHPWYWHTHPHAEPPGRWSAQLQEDYYQYPEMPARVWTALRYAKIPSLAALCAMEDKEIMRLRNISGKTLKALRAVWRRGPAHPDPWDEWADTLPGWRRP